MISAADDGGLLADCSLEVAGKDVDGLEHARAHLPPGTRFEVAFVDSEDLAARHSGSSSRTSPAWRMPAPPPGWY